MFAARNIRLCSKDCVCLFICPTGATDTENGQIDKTRCLDGCRLCVDTCPSGAIYLVPEKFAEPQSKEAEVVESLLKLLDSKCSQERVLDSVLENFQGKGEKGGKKLAKALKQSCRILAEDCAREAGFMFTQSSTARVYLKDLRDTLNTEQQKLVDLILET